MVKNKIDLVPYEVKGIPTKDSFLVKIHKVVGNLFMEGYLRAIKGEQAFNVPLIHTRNFDKKEMENTYKIASEKLLALYNKE